MGQQVQLTVIQGNDVTVDLAVLEEDGVTPQNLTGLTPQMIIKESSRAPDAGATILGTGTGLTVVSAPGGTLTALIPRADLSAAGTIWWRLDLIDGSGEITTCMYGNLVITPV